MHTIKGSLTYFSSYFWNNEPLTQYIHQGHERFSVLSRGDARSAMSMSALLFDKLGSSACCHWTAENVDHILEFGDKIILDSLQEGLFPDTKTLSISNLPFGVHWTAESSKAVDLPILRAKTGRLNTTSLNQA